MKILVAEPMKMYILKVSKNILKKNKIGAFQLTNFKNYYKAAVIYWHKGRHLDQWDEIQSQESNFI